MARHVTKGPEETKALGEKLAEHLRPGMLVAFTGGLGAGKTTFCHGVAKALGCVDPVASPTYAIVNVYRGPVQLAHFDLYRIETETDLETAGFYDYLDMGAVVMVEWSERLPLPQPDVTIHIEKLDAQTRAIEIEGVEGL